MTDSAGGLPDEIWNAPREARREEMFPRLASDQLARLARLGGERTVAPGEHLFRPGQADIPFYVIVDGELEIVHGFLKTGGDLSRDDLKGAGWRLGRPPHRFETSTAHVFAVGDVRAGSVKRVSAAVGEGAGCVQLIHAALGE